MPADRIAALRAAFAATFKDPQFLADCKKQGVECDDSRTGEQMDAHIARPTHPGGDQEAAGRDAEVIRAAAQRIAAPSPRLRERA